MLSNNLNFYWKPDMTFQQFGFWLQGFLAGKESLDSEQIQAILKQLEAASEPLEIISDPVPNPWTWPSDGTGSPTNPPYEVWCSQVGQNFTIGEGSNNYYC